MPARPVVPLPLLVCLGALRWQASLLAAIAEADSGLHVARRCRDGVELLAAATAGVAQIAVVADSDLPAEVVAGLAGCGAVQVDLAEVLPVGALAAEAVDPATLAGLLAHLRGLAPAEPGAGAGQWSDANLAALRSAHPSRRRPSASAAHEGPVQGTEGTGGAGATAGAAGAAGADPSGARPAGGRPFGAGPSDADTSGAHPSEVPLGPSAAAEVAPPHDPTERHLVVVWGPPGAPGVTTVALHIADEAARAGRDTLLIDADIDGGVLGQRLALVDEPPGMSAACAVAEQEDLSAELLGDHVRALRPGLQLLTGLPHAGRWTDWRPFALTSVWRAAGELAEVVVVDAGHPLPDDDLARLGAPHRAAAAVTALAAASHVVIVGSADPLGMVRLVEAVTRLDLPADLPRTVVLNRCGARAFRGARREDLLAVIARTAPSAQVQWLPEDGRRCAAAVLHGVPLAGIAPRCRLRRQLRQMSAALLSP